MKNKTKLVLGLAALTAVTAGVATTSTLAWFTTSRNASVNFTSAGIYSNNGNLKIGYTKMDASTTTSNKEATEGNIDITGNTAAGTTDVSLDFKTPYDTTTNKMNFYQPVWNPTTTNNASAYNSYMATSFGRKTNSADTAFYTYFQVTLTNSGTNKFNVYLSSKTAITAKSSITVPTDTADASYTTKSQAASDQSAKVLNSARVAVFKNNGASSAPTMLSYFAPAGATLSYVESTSTGTYLYGVDGYTSGSVTPSNAAKTGTTNVAHVGPFADVTTTANGLSYNTIAEDLGTTAITLDVYCWLEGTATGAVEAVKGAQINFVLDFVAVA